MKLSRFLGYLRMFDCEETGFGRIHFIYKNPANGKKANIPNEDPIDDVAIYYACKKLGIEVPPECKEFQTRFDSIK